MPETSSPQKVDPLIDPFNHAHANSDVDIDFDSLHHSLGVSETQAAPGNHNHFGAPPVTTSTVTAITVTEKAVVGFDDLIIDVPHSTTGNVRYLVTVSLVVSVSATPTALVIRLRDGGNAGAPTNASTMLGQAPFESPSSTNPDVKFVQFSILLAQGRHNLGVFVARQSGTGTVSAGNAVYPSSIAIQPVGIS